MSRDFHMCQMIDVPAKGSCFPAMYHSGQNEQSRHNAGSKRLTHEKGGGCAHRCNTQTDHLCRTGSAHSPQDTPYKQRQLHRDCNSRKEGRAKVVGGPGEMEVGKRTYHTFQTSIGVQFRIRNNANWQRL